MIFKAVLPNEGDRFQLLFCISEEHLSNLETCGRSDIGGERRGAGTDSVEGTTLVKKQLRQ